MKFLLRLIDCIAFDVAILIVGGVIGFLLSTWEIEQSVVEYLNVHGCPLEVML